MALEIESRAEKRVSPFEKRPVLVFWETTKACLLACQHCRARAQQTALPGELTTSEGERLLADIAAFGHPAPVVVFTGGDLLMRPDIFHLLQFAKSLGLRMAVSPSATQLAADAVMQRFTELGVHSLSLSLDGPEDVHDRIRGIPGTFQSTLSALHRAQAAGVSAQINTVVMRRTVEHLPEVVSLLLREGVHVWEVFFLIATGRALASEYLTPQEWSDVSDFLIDVTGYGLLVRAIEGPFVRRALIERHEGIRANGALYHRLVADLERRAGKPVRQPQMTRVGTLDGDGIVFVTHDGWITPGGFLPIHLGHVRHDRITDVYRTHPLLLDIRRRKFSGPCGQCRFSDVCGGSRARSFAHDWNPLGSDPACPLVTREPDTV